MIKKKILIYTMAMIKGGTERTISNLSNYFIDKYNITIVCNINHESDYKLDPRIKLIFIDKTDKINEKIQKKIFTKIGPYRTKKLKEIINEEKPNLIISFLPEPTIRSLYLKNYFSNINIIVAIRNTPKKEFRTPIRKLLRNYYYNKADSILIQDESFINYLPNKLINKITVIPNYISNSFINTKINNKKENRIITITRLEKQKNIPLLIKSFSKLNTKYKNYKLYIYGKGSLEKKLLIQINKLNLNKRVFLVGTTNNIIDEMNKAYLFVLPSNYEGMPNSLLEAMSLGLPVISTNSSKTIPNIIKNNENGIIVRKNNQKELTKKIEYLLNNKKQANILGKEALYVRDKYNQEKIIKYWEQIIITFIN